MSREKTEFAEFFRDSWEPCLRAVGRARRRRLGGLSVARARHGIPALVTAGRFCRTAEQPAPGVGQVVVLPQGHPRLTPGQRPSGPGPGPIVIHGAAIPRGVELSIGYRQDSSENEISFSLIKAGAPLTCTSLPDHGPHGGD